MPVTFVSCCVVLLLYGSLSSAGACVLLLYVSFLGKHALKGMMELHMGKKEQTTGINLHGCLIMTTSSKLAHIYIDNYTPSVTAANYLIYLK